MNKSLIVAVALIQGCATTQGTWYRQGATEAEFYAERSQCKVVQLSAPRQRTLMGAVESDELFGHCMMGKGWAFR